ncbi:MAG TPA: valine--tRNA ligase [Candidatus Bathyarchaeia archaeon]|nr:valine--tRNA ligase [Candidatus Bathyarchaeia archaeon]
MSRSDHKESEHSSENQSRSSPEFALGKNYEPAVEETKWQEYWRQNDIYHFDAHEKSLKTFSIDTPPPYPSGDFHVGNALNWCYIDFVARYKRMKGFNVHFPQGWDCHGLPTEVRVEQTFKVRKNDLPPEQFIEMCRKLTGEYITKMKQSMNRLGISSDWSLEYRTMDPAYYKLTQLSFLQLYKSNHLYRGEHPVNWCPRDETAIAEAEVVYHERKGILYFMKFGSSNDNVEIASTRPELLAACVGIAVNPKDERYKAIVGKNMTVPIFGQKARVIADDEVDSQYGTGAVMICTFGDKTDVRWQKKYHLPVIKALTESGRLSVDDPRFKGLKTEEARKKIVAELRAQGLINKTETTQQNIGTCWRCQTPVEIIARPQWFMKTRDMTRNVVEWAGKLDWIPPFAKQRLIDWAESLDWDWVISRQRIFATPIPIWYCTKCHTSILPDESKLPVDPRKDKPPQEKCSNCGSQELIGETDVLDTWMDSSITAPVHAGWPNDSDLFARLFPADLQPNGLDIVRTWDYYLLVRNLALFRTAPYKTLLINGMVKGTDGRMMHKSYGNYVEADEAIRKVGADALRQWAAAGGSTGYDIPFRWNELEYGKKFLTKLWNVARFVLTNRTESLSLKKPTNPPLIDRWLLASIQKLTEQVSDAFETFQFNVALEAIRNFTWHALADDYLEAVKHRLQAGGNSADFKATQYCLQEALLTICKLLAPICPHMSEAIYHQFPSGIAKSIHQEHWPERDRPIDDTSIHNGALLLNVIAQLRREKSSKGLSLGSNIKKIVVRTDAENLHLLKENEETILKTLKADSIELERSPTNPSQGREQTPGFRVELIV